MWTHIFSYTHALQSWHTMTLGRLYFVYFICQSHSGSQTTEHFLQKQCTMCADFADADTSFLERLLPDQSLFLERLLPDQSLFLERLLPDQSLFLERLLPDQSLFLERLLPDQSLFLERLLPDQSLFLERLLPDQNLFPWFLAFFLLFCNFLQPLVTDSFELKPVISEDS